MTVLFTKRLLLRPFTREDGEAMHALNADREVLRYTGDSPFENVEATANFLDAYDQYEKYSVGRMLTVRQDTGETLGWCRLKYHPESDEYDIGYRFFKKYWGNGYATESAKAAIEDGFNRLHITRIVGRARVENIASIRVLEKLGMKWVNNFVEDDENWVLYEIVC
ncbi:GNAT family N-acetyltransferase [Sphingobacterium sp. LRF_L2]|uniref:GNAT family N-acetyltransferase n=1 Tax=Sphingobacterium sp. LRF_L2 TaxID=3369421 RepID=UPI003F61B985